MLLSPANNQKSFSMEAAELFSALHSVGSFYHHFHDDENVNELSQHHNSAASHALLFCNITLRANIVFTLGETLFQMNNKDLI